MNLANVHLADRSIAALRKYLREQGFMDEIVFRRIYDVVVKTVLSIEVTVSSAVERFVQDRHNCFSLLGFVPEVSCRCRQPRL